MNALFGLVLTGLANVLQFVAVLSASTTCVLWTHQPKTPKSLLK